VLDPVHFAAARYTWHKGQIWTMCTCTPRLVEAYHLVVSTASPSQRRRSPPTCVCTPSRLTTAQWDSPAMSCRGSLNWISGTGSLSATTPLSTCWSMRLNRTPSGTSSGHKVLHETVGGTSDAHPARGHLRTVVWQSGPSPEAAQAHASAWR
jgi:hypothetical protein